MNVFIIRRNRPQEIKEEYIQTNIFPPPNPRKSINFFLDLHDAEEWQRRFSVVSQQVYYVNCETYEVETLDVDGHGMIKFCPWGEPSYSYFLEGDKVMIFFDDENEDLEKEDYCHEVSLDESPPFRSNEFFSSEELALRRLDYHKKVNAREQERLSAIEAQRLDYRSWNEDHPVESEL